jgi:hypothetical protein
MGLWATMGGLSRGSATGELSFYSHCIEAFQVESTFFTMDLLIQLRSGGLAHLGSFIIRRASKTSIALQSLIFPLNTYF